MLGLMVLGFFALYFGASFWLTRATWRWAKNNQRSKAWAYLVGFAMYNVVFWDWIPTLVTHEYLCSTQAGVKTYKPVEKIGLNETNFDGIDLRSSVFKKLKEPVQINVAINSPYKFARKISGATYIVDSIYKDYDINPLMLVLPIRISSEYYADISTKEVLIEKIDFKAGYGNPMTTGGISGFKSWLEIKSCFGFDKLK